MLVVEKAIELIKIAKYGVEDTDCALHEILESLNLKTCNCQTTDCDECLYKSLVLLSQEYKEPIELTQFEYDMLMISRD